MDLSISDQLSPEQPQEQFSVISSGTFGAKRLGLPEINGETGLYHKNVYFNPEYDDPIGQSSSIRSNYADNIKELEAKCSYKTQILKSPPGAAMDLKQCSDEVMLSPSSKDIYLLPQGEQNLLICNQDEMSLASNQRVEMNTLWKIRGLWILFYITKFLRQVKTHSRMLKLKLMKPEYLELIDDRSSDSTELLKTLSLMQKYGFKHTFFTKLSLTEIFVKTKTISSDLVKILPIFQPDGVFKILWEIFYVIFLTLNIFYIPLKISFELNSSHLEFYFHKIPSWFFIADILVSLNTAYYHSGMFHQGRYSIIRHYVKHKFQQDCIVVLPFIILPKVPYGEFFYLLRIARIKPVFQNLEEIINLKENMQMILDLSKSAFFVLFVAHLVACCWHYLGQVQANQYGLSSYLVTSGSLNQIWHVRYIQALYFSIITTLTIGYGDLVPTTEVERIFVILVAMVICGVFGYTISNIGETFKVMLAKREHFKIQMRSINLYLKQKNINKQLQLKVMIRKYFEYYFQIEQSKNIEGERLINQLTKKLREEFNIDLYKKILCKSKIINKPLSTETIQKLCCLMKEDTYAPEQDIFQVGEVATKLIYVVKGKLQVMTNNPKKCLKIIHEGHFVGEKEFATQQRYRYLAQASNFTTIAFINYIDFIQVVNENRDDLLKFCYTRDQLTFNQNRSVIGKVCEICQWTHNFDQCPFVFNQPHKGRIEYAYKQSFEMKREQIERSQRYHRNTFEDLRYVKELALDYIVTNELIGNDVTEDYIISLGLTVDQMLTDVNNQDKVQVRQSTLQMELEQSQDQEKEIELKQLDQKISKTDSSKSPNQRGRASISQARRSVQNAFNLVVKKSGSTINLDQVLMAIREPTKSLGKVMRFNDGKPSLLLSTPKSSRSSIKSGRDERRKSRQRSKFAPDSKNARLSDRKLQLQQSTLSDGSQSQSPKQTDLKEINQLDDQGGTYELVFDHPLPESQGYYPDFDLQNVLKKLQEVRGRQITKSRHKPMYTMFRKKNDDQNRQNHKPINIYDLKMMKLH